MFVAGSSKDEEGAVLMWTGVGLYDVVGLSRDKEWAIMTKIGPLWSNREIEHGPCKSGVGMGPKIEGGTGYRVDGGRWTLDKVVNAGKWMAWKDLTY